MAVVGSMFVLLGVLPALPAAAQRFMPQEIVQAEKITQEMNDQIIALVEPPMFDLSDEEVDLDKVTKAREQIMGYFRLSRT